MKNAIILIYNYMEKEKANSLVKFDCKYSIMYNIHIVVWGGNLILI